MYGLDFQNAISETLQSIDGAISISGEILVFSKNQEATDNLI